jgi:hypothetical protein
MSGNIGYINRNNMEETMDKVNGFTIIAHRPYGSKNDGLVIFGVKKSQFSDSGFEYVTAVVSAVEDKDWSWGHYFNSLDRAHEDYNKR